MPFSPATVERRRPQWRDAEVPAAFGRDPARLFWFLPQWAVHEAQVHVSKTWVEPAIEAGQAY